MPAQHCLFLKRRDLKRYLLANADLPPKIVPVLKRELNIFEEPLVREGGSPNILTRDSTKKTSSNDLENKIITSKALGLAMQIVIVIIKIGREYKIIGLNEYNGKNVRYI